MDYECNFTMQNNLTYLEIYGNPGWRCQTTLAQVSEVIKSCPLLRKLYCKVDLCDAHFGITHYKQIEMWLRTMFRKLKSLIEFRVQPCYWVHRDLDAMDDDYDEWTQYIAYLFLYPEEKAVKFRDFDTFLISEGIFWFWGVCFYHKLLSVCYSIEGARLCFGAMHESTGRRNQVGLFNGTYVC